MAAEAVSAFEPEELADLKGWFLDCGVEVQPVCCVRKLSEWLTWMVAQRVSGHMGPRLTIEAAVQEFAAARGIVVQVFGHCRFWIVLLHASTH